MRKLAKRDHFRFYKKPTTFTRVVWAEESKTGLGFEIGPVQQKL